MNHFAPCSKHFNSQARGENLFPPHEVGGKTVKMLLVVAKSDSYARNENSYYNMIQESYVHSLIKFNFTFSPHIKFFPYDSQVIFTFSYKI